MRLRLRLLQHGTELACVGSRQAAAGAGGRTDGARAGLVVEELLVLAWDGMDGLDAYSFELAAVVTLPHWPLVTDDARRFPSRDLAPGTRASVPKGQRLGQEEWRTKRRMHR